MIKIKNLSFSYQKKSPLFSDFSLELHNGHIVGLLGKNGAGKSTLLSLIAGLLQPSSGTIDVDGFKPFDRKPDFLADIYFVPEEFDFPGVSIATYVKAFAPFYPSFDNGKLAELLEEFELQTSSNLNKLSHGQRKKFLIAFALATNCKVMVLDEPTNGLDIPSKSQFRKILVSSVTEEQLVIISTHQVKDIDTIVDEVLVLDEAKVLYHKSVDEITQDLYFETISTLGENDSVLYSEKCPSGYRVVKRSNGITESGIDLELLFNAIINRTI